MQIRTLRNRSRMEWDGVQTKQSQHLASHFAIKKNIMSVMNHDSVVRLENTDFLRALRMRIGKKMRKKVPTIMQLKIYTFLFFLGYFRNFWSQNFMKVLHFYLYQILIILKTAQK